MRKGDESKQQIIRAAERLFCANGFDETSVQRILEEVHGSKGGFYHHFASKEDLLRAICMQRAEAAASRVLNEVSEPDPLRQLDRLLGAVMPFSKDDLVFMGMLIPILDRPESTPVRVGYQDALAAAFGPMVQGCIEETAADGTLMPAGPNITAPVMTLLNACWYDTALLLLKNIREGRPTDPSALLERLTTCRRCLEVLLDAPYGSLTLVSLEDWAVFAEGIARQIRRQ